MARDADPPSRAELLIRVRQRMVFSQRELAVAAGTSLRSMQRMTNNKGVISDEELHRLAALVYPRDAGLAADLAHATGRTLEGLGIVKPPPLPEPAPVAPVVSPSVLAALVESVVAAAAEALDVSPRVARPALLAAIERARAVDLTLDDLHRALRPPPSPAAKVGSSRRPAPA